MKKETPKIVYVAPAGAPAALAAGIHLGLLPGEERPRITGLLNAPYFGALGKADRGFFHFCGYDGQGREVYLAVVAERAFPLVKRAVAAAAELAGLPREAFYLVDCRPALTTLAVFGGRCWDLFSRPGRGRRFLAWTLRSSYPRLLELVHRVGRIPG